MFACCILAILLLQIHESPLVSVSLSISARRAPLRSTPPSTPHAPSTHFFPYIISTASSSIGPPAQPETSPPPKNSISLGVDARGRHFRHEASVAKPWPPRLPRHSPTHDRQTTSSFTRRNFRWKHYTAPRVRGLLASGRHGTVRQRHLRLPADPGDHPQRRGVSGDESAEHPQNPVDQHAAHEGGGDVHRGRTEWYDVVPFMFVRWSSSSSLPSSSRSSSSYARIRKPIIDRPTTLRRHSLSDGQGGHYGTNLDRNRYGSDNNYLFTVTKYNLERYVCPMITCIDLPTNFLTTRPTKTRTSVSVCALAWVDIEIVDTRNGNESNVVSVGSNACNCEDPSRVALQDSTALVLGGDASKKRKISEKKKMMKKSASFTQRERAV